MSRFDELRQLKRNWDSYDSLPIDPATIDRAELFVNRMQIMPCSDGGVQLEWHTHGYDIELTFNPDGTTALFVQDGKPGGAHE